MQNIHQQFYDFILGLPNGAEIAKAYKDYKTATDGSAFELNGRLKAGLDLGPWLPMFSSLKKAICAQNIEPLTLYRMTSETQFIGPLISVLEGKPFRHAAFMSTSASADRLHSFVPPASETPLVLEITCRPGTFMALLEAHVGAAEDEFLLGCGTEFIVSGPPEVLDASDAAVFTGSAAGGRAVKKLCLMVHQSPPYAGGGKVFTF